jgi:flavin-dependent dehydrogenase
MSQDCQYDVAIVGAGPAGLSAARTVARLGFSAILFEQLAQPGDLQHPCSALITPVPGFIGARRLLDGLFLPSLDLLIPSSLILGFLPAQKFVSPGGYEWRATFGPQHDFPAAVLDKAGLLRLMARQARSAGAELRGGAKVTGLLKQDERVVGVRLGEREVRTSLVICAEGADRLLSREAGLCEPDMPGQHVVLINQEMVAPGVRAEHVGQILTAGRRYTTAPRAFGMLLLPAPGRASIFFTIYVDARRPLSDRFGQFYVDEYVRTDARVRDVLRGAWVVSRAQRSIELQNAPEHVVAHGFMGAGDTITPAGHLGILPSIYVGRQAAFVAAEALDSGDLSPRGLAAYDTMLHESILPNLETEAQAMLGMARLGDEEIDRLCQSLSAMNVSKPVFSNWRTLAWDVIGPLVREFPLLLHDWHRLQQTSQGASEAGA